MPRIVCCHVAIEIIIGVWTELRASDYNNLSPDNIQAVMDGNEEFLIVTLHQQKTGRFVEIPCNYSGEVHQSGQAGGCAEAGAEELPVFQVMNSCEETSTGRLVNICRRRLQVQNGATA